MILLFYFRKNTPHFQSTPNGKRKRNETVPFANHGRHTRYRAYPMADATVNAACGGSETLFPDIFCERKAARCSIPFHYIGFLCERK